MSAKIEELSFSGSLTNDSILPTIVNPQLDFISTKNINSIGIFYYANQEVGMTLNWSSNGVDIDVIQSFTILAGTTIEQKITVKSSYLMINLVLTTSPTIFRAETIFFFPKVK